MSGRRQSQGEKPETAPKEIQENALASFLTQIETGKGEGALHDVFLGRAVQKLQQRPRQLSRMDLNPAVGIHFMVIRKFREEEAERVCKLVSKTFEEFVAPEFTKEGVEKWLQDEIPEKQIERSRSRDTYVATVNHEIVGVIEPRGNRGITRLFVDRGYHRRGIGRELLDTIEAIYRRRGATRIKVRSSLYAEGFYEKMGYKKSTGLIRKGGMVYQPTEKNSC